jgi:thioredoxin-like negative regulator of GroEL
LGAAAARAEVGVLIQKARLAQRRKDWHGARDLWRTCVEKAPEDRTAAVGYISVLIYTGQIEEAATRAVAFARKHPKDENGATLLARIAEARHDLGAAAERWRAVLHLHPSKTQALIRLGGVLVRAKRFEEANACADQLERHDATKPYGLVLRAQIAQQQHGFSRAAPLWRTGDAQFGTNADFLRAYARALLLACEFEQCLEVADRLQSGDAYEAIRLRGAVLEKREPFQNRIAFWKSACTALPDNINLTRKLLDAALWTRQQVEAQTAFDRLIRQGQLRASDADYAVGLALSYLENGDKAAARSVVRTFMRGLRGQPDYRAAALRLERIILACFPRKLGAAVTVSRDRTRFPKMIIAATLEASATRTLREVGHLEAAIAERNVNCLLDSDIDPEACRAFIRFAREHLADGKPLSLIRLGDGEANAFQQEGPFASHFDSDAAEREVVWWGRTLNASERQQLADAVRAASLRADVLGFPTREWFLRDIRLDGGAPLSAARSGRGLLTILHLVEKEWSAGSLSRKALVSAHLPQDLQRWNLYGELFDGLRDVVLVSCHPALPDAFHARFGVNVARHVLVAPGDSMREIQQRVLADAEMPPQSIVRALANLGDAPRRRMVLVGAGYAGKVIVDEAKRRGGIALDLGSIFDHWVGAHTRSYQDLA